MHEYYAKKTSKLKKAMNGLLKPISGELNKYSGKPYADVFSEIWEHYKNIRIICWKTSLISAGITSAERAI